MSQDLNSPNQKVNELMEDALRRLRSLKKMKKALNSLESQVRSQEHVLSLMRRQSTSSV